MNAQFPIDESDTAVGADYGAYAPGAGARAVLALTRGTFLGRGKARRTMGRLFERLHSGPVDTEVWGAPVRLFPHGNVSDKKALLNPGRFNREELRAVGEWMSKPGSIFVDVGANVGLFSLYAARFAAAGSKILAFEPHPGLFRRMAFNLRAEALSRPPGDIDLRIKRLALGDREGTARLEVHDRDLGSCRIAADSETDGDGSAVDVPMRPLLDVLREEGVTHISMLKIDVEGFEDKVLGPFFQSAEPALWPASMIMEHHFRDNWTFDCMGECEARGYKVRKISKSNSLLTRFGAPDGD